MLYGIWYCQYQINLFKKINLTNNFNFVVLFFDINQNSFFLSFKKIDLFIMTKDNSFQNLFNNIISKINLFLQKGIMVK